MSTGTRRTLSFMVVGLAFCSLACGGHQCTRTQYPGDLPTEAQERLAARGLVDGMEMETCTLGQYKARMVTVKGEQVLFVFQDDTPLYSSSLMGSTMFADGDAVADLPSPRSGAPRSLVYHADDRVSGARVMVVDRDLDGQPDLRARRYPDNRSESEVWFKDGWRAQVTRGNERGVMIEGEFTPIDEIPALQR